MAYQPVTRRTSGPLRVTALTGSHSVCLGWDLDEDRVGDDLLGFAVKRTDYLPGSSEPYRMQWLNGQKRFRTATDVGLDVRSDQAPFQRFRWNDYTVSSDFRYRYTVTPIRGTPDALTHDPSISVDVEPTPTAPTGTSPGIFVNRGVTSAHAYLERFHGTDPHGEADEPRRWLTRGLEEAVLAFIDASVSGDALHVAIYEFHHEPVADALARAVQRGVDVQLVVHAMVKKTKKSTDHTWAESKELLQKTGLLARATPRTRTAISHNKFIVHSRNGVPQRVWTGTANFTFNAFYLQTNLGMVLEDPVVADGYLDYWTVLAQDPDPNDEVDGLPEGRTAVRAVMDDLDARLDKLQVFYSPISSDEIVEQAVDLIAEATTCAFVSAPFFIDKRIVAAIAANDPRIIEYGLVNTTAKGGLKTLDQRPTTQFYAPAVLETWMGRAWDAKAFGDHKIHVKSVVIDPWGPHPAVLVGSSNFSKPSCRDNDENSLLIRGDKRLAAVIATEFLRMFDHYKSRNFINQLAKGPEEDHFLDEDSGWSRTAFSPTSRSHKYRDRQTFVGDP